MSTDSALGDRRDFLRVNEFAQHTPWLHGPVLAWADGGVAVFALLLLAGFALARRRRDLLLVVRSLLSGAGVLLAVAVNQPIVHAVREARPYDQLPGVLVLVHRSVDASFPSDHATMAGAVAVGLLPLDRRLGLVASVAAVLMAFARVYVGAHFPVDVLAGLVVGGVVAAAVQRAAPLASRLVTPLLGTPLGVVLLPRQSEREPRGPEGARSVA